jgi:aspartyl/glutamyl-tRNA(Asn/Gln) amidotransferase C subunit
MDTISKEEVRKIAQISNILVNETEVEQLQKELGQVLEYAARVTKVIGDAPELKDPVLRNIRKDEVASIDGQQIVAHAPVNDSGYFVVPLIIEQ